MRDRSLCFRCAFWTMLLDGMPDPNRVIVSGRSYYITPDRTDGYRGPGVGFGGNYNNNPNTAAAFDGVDNFVQVPATLLSTVGTGAFSMELWFNKTPGSGRGDLFNIKGAGGDFGIISEATDALSVYWDGTILPAGGLRKEPGLV